MDGYRTFRMRLSSSVTPVITQYNLIFGYETLDLEIDHINNDLIFTVLCQDKGTIFDKLEGVHEVMYHFINGDVVEAAKTGEVFLYLGGMYYNLSSGGKEMRGRKAIKRSHGPVKKLSNIANSGELFKEAIKEARQDDEKLPF